MKLSLDWLSEYVSVPFTPEELDHRLTMLGLEVEGIENFAKKFEKIVVGHVLEVVPHPNADKLRLTRVDIGSGEPLRIVCGAPNVREGLKVAVATVGADLGGGFVIKKSKIRGEASEGMLCSERELGLSESHEGIWELPQDLVIGVPLAKALGKDSVVMEIGITPNRPDCLSHLGVAREIVAITDQSVKLPQVTITEDSSTDISTLAEVTIEDPDLCPRYVARIIRGVKVQDSPAWLKKRLEEVGLRPINNIVDITNYVLMECGHPLHAFDLSQIADGHIVVRRANGFAQEFTTLDSKKRKLDSDTLLISDTKKPLAIAGIMGGENSEISLSTTDVLLESAYFNPSSIRRSSKRLGLSTDASYRFERGTDIEMLNYAADRAAQLIAELGGGTLLAGRIDVYPAQQEPKRFRFRPSRANALLGTAIQPSRMREVFQKLNVGIEETSEDEWTLTSPSYRVDLAREEDAIEEVARVIGYEEIPTTVSERTLLPTKKDPLPGRTFDELVRGALLSLGVTECVSTPLVPEKEASTFHPQPVKVVNPLNVEMTRMRTNLAGNLLTIAQRNERFGARGQKLFEVGTVFGYGEKPGIVGNVHERPELAILLSGVQEEKSAYNAAEVKADIFGLRGMVEAFFSRLGIRQVKISAMTGENFVPWQNAGSYLDTNLALKFETAQGKLLAIAGRIKPSLQTEYDLRSEPFVALIDYKTVNTLVREMKASAAEVKPLPKYPAIERDIALVLKASTRAQEIETAIRSAVSSNAETAKLLQEVRLFDEYISKEMKAAGERSLAFHLVFRVADRTLEEQEIDSVMQSILSALETTIGARLRA